MMNKDPGTPPWRAVLMVLVTLALVGAGAGVRALAAGATLQPAASAGDWPMYGHDPARTNFNPAETVITRATVANLVPRWQAQVGSNGVAPSGAPSVADGRVYVASSVATGPN